MSRQSLRSALRQDNLAQAKEDEKTQYTALKARIKAMYESGDDDYLQMLLGSGDLKTMLNNQEYISKINEYDHNLLVSLRISEIRLQHTKLSSKSRRSFRKLRRNSMK
ncbi:MAG: coiled-coil domain-containing protein [Lachnospiraceae bacterium]